MELADPARKLLEGNNFAFIATLNSDGSPQVTPVWVDTDGKYIIINTCVGRVKHVNTKRDPRVAVAIAEQANRYNFTTVRGRVIEQTTGKAAEDHIDKLAKKYMGVDRHPLRRANQRRVILRIKPERVFIPR